MEIQRDLFTKSDLKIGWFLQKVLFCEEFDTEIHRELLTRCSLETGVVSQGSVDYRNVLWSLEYLFCAVLIKKT